MALAKRSVERVSPGDAALPGALIRPLFAPIETLLVSGGDQRLNLSGPLRQNVYGCSPFPRTESIDFASSTASSISEEAYARALKARDAYLAKVIFQDARHAFDDTVADTRRALLKLLDLQNDGIEAVFAASGTDAQILSLFLAKSILGTSLATIVVGADQTGSGIGYTACGQHFSHVTAGGHTVAKGQPVDGLADGIHNINVPFLSPADGLRTPAQMDQAVENAVATAIADGHEVLLQTMDASKFGWRAPSDACVEKIMRRWPKQVLVVADVCQMRCSRGRLKTLLGAGCMVLVTGSKFFTGPAFSGALLVPPKLFAKISAIGQAPSGLAAYTSAYDWPQAWVGLRSLFPDKANFGQWLRWEAALEEMRLYYDLPPAFRESVHDSLAAHIGQLIEASPCLRLLSYGPSPQTHEAKTIFAVLPQNNAIPLSAARCATLYQALRNDLGKLVCGTTEDSEKRAASISCRVGQPVPLHGQDAAVFRIGVSARMIRQCWSPEPDVAKAKIDGLLNHATLLVEKLNFAVRHIEKIEAALS